VTRPSRRMLPSGRSLLRPLQALRTYRHATGCAWRDLPPRCNGSDCKQTALSGLPGWRVGSSYAGRNVDSLSGKFSQRNQ
jgi:hypothetical protein